MRRLLVLLLLLIPVSVGYWPHQVVAPYDVLIQAGHEGRLEGATGAVGQHGREIDWTPIVADTATKLLRAQGYRVARVDADFSWLRSGRYPVKLALYLHFDGSNNACGSGASVGYPAKRDAATATAWKRHYSQHWPYRWMPDNFTTNLSRYYGYAYTNASEAKLLLEFGELSCPQQGQWLSKRLPQLGQWLAEFVTQQLPKPRQHPLPPTTLPAVAKKSANP